MSCLSSELSRFFIDLCELDELVMTKNGARIEVTPCCGNSFHAFCLHQWGRSQLRAPGAPPSDIVLHVRMLVWHGQEKGRART